MADGVGLPDLGIGWEVTCDLMSCWIKLTSTGKTSAFLEFSLFAVNYQINVTLVNQARNMAAHVRMHQ